MTYDELNLALDDCNNIDEQISLWLKYYNCPDEHTKITGRIAYLDGFFGKMKYIERDNLSCLKCKNKAIRRDLLGEK